MNQSVIFALFLTAVSAVPTSINYLNYISLDEIEDGATYSFDFEYKSLTRINATSCVKPGPICDGCESVYECIQIGSGFIIEFLNNCPAGSTCLESSGACTTETNPICDEIGYNFTCRQVGVFPDAFNCQKYHLCIPGDDLTTVKTESVEQKCKSNFYYDPKMALCRKKLVNNKCDAVAKPCTSAGEAGVVSSNPALYYICLRGANSENFLPQMFSCQDDWIYDITTKACFDPSPKPATGTNGLCTEVGNFYDPTSVFFYFSCSSAGGSPLRRACETNRRFNHAKQECVDITWKNFDLYEGIIF